MCALLHEEDKESLLTCHMARQRFLSDDRTILNRCFVSYDLELGMGGGRD